jgi:hypothetical protein
METGRRPGIVQGAPSPASCGVAAGGLFFWKIRKARTLVDVCSAERDP